VQLLEPAELHVFTALGVFVGGCTVAAAEDVGGASLDELQSLTEKSLLRRADGRLLMLETVREYARERLAASDAGDEVEQRHAHYYLELKQAADGPFPTVTATALVDELPNIRAAVAFAALRGDVALEFALLGQTTELMNDSLPQYRLRLEHLLAASPAVEPAVLARCLGNLCFAAYLAGDLERARQLAQLEYDIGVGVSEWFESAALNSLSGVYLAEGDATAARGALERAAVLQERVGARRAAAITKINLADTLVVEGEYATAANLCGEASAVFAELDDPIRTMIAELNGATAAVLGVLPQASEMVARALQAATGVGDGYGTAVALQLVAALAARVGDTKAAAFLGAADELRTRSGHALEPTETRVREAILATGVEPTKAPDPDAAVAAAQTYLSAALTDRRGS
jgi:hypothetical protein